MCSNNMFLKLLFLAFNLHIIICNMHINEQGSLLTNDDFNNSTEETVLGLSIGEQMNDTSVTNEDEENAKHVYNSENIDNNFTTILLKEEMLKKDFIIYREFSNSEDPEHYLSLNESKKSLFNISDDYSVVNESDSEEYDDHNNEENIPLLTLIINELKANGNDSTGSLTTDGKFTHMIDKIKKLYNIVMKDLTPMMIEQILTTNISLTCMSGLAKAYDALNNNDQWVYKMIDSNGHLPSGLMSGTLTSLGDYDQCLDVKSTDHQILGQYCLLKIRVHLPEKKNVIKFNDRIIDLNGTDLQNTWIESFVTKSIYHFYYFSLTNGMCVPSTCSQTDLLNIVQIFLSPFHLVVDIDNCSTRDGLPLQLNRGQKLALFIIIGFVCIAIFATFVNIVFIKKINAYNDIHKGWSGENRQIVFKVIQCFSLMANIEKFFNTTSHVKPEGHKYNFKFIYGLKVLSMFWVIIGHTYISGALFFNKDIPTANFYADNLVDTINLPKQLFTQFIINGLLAVDTFFFISGFLVIYLSVNKIRAEHQDINFCNYVLFRWIRFAPLLIAIMAMNLLWPLLGSGPLFHADYISKITEPCYKYWWRNLLFISNWYPNEEQCMIHTWYLSADFQFYIISFFIIKSSCSNINKGIVITSILTVVGIVVPTLIAYDRQLPPTILYEADIEEMSNNISLMHYKTYNHISTYFMGSLVACLLLKMKSYSINPFFQWFLWTTTCFGSLFVVFFTYVWTNLEWKYTRLSASLYFGFHRLIWAHGLAWIAYNCAHNRRVLVNKILSSNVFKLTSRLTFSIYMSHMIIIWFNFFRTKHLFSTTHYDMLFTASGVYGFTLVFAFINHIIFEAPIDNLVKILMNFKLHKVDKNENDVNFKTMANKTSEPDITHVFSNQYFN